ENAGTPVWATWSGPFGVDISPTGFSLSASLILLPPSLGFLCSKVEIRFPANLLRMFAKTTLAGRRLARAPSWQANSRPRRFRHNELKTLDVKIASQPPEPKKR